MNAAEMGRFPRRIRMVTTGLLLIAVAGVQLAGVMASSAGTVTNPKLANVSHGRFTSMVVLDGGAITIRPAPAGTVTTQTLAAVTAKIWASSQLVGFTEQTLGYGYVTIKSAPQLLREAPVDNVLGWVGFANGNASGACTTNKAKKFRSNGESAVFIGDASPSDAVSFVPPECGFPDRSGFMIPNEIVSVPWVKVGTANARGIVTFRTASAQCGAIEGSAFPSGKGAAIVELLTETPDWSATACSATVLQTGVPVARTRAKANDLRLIHGGTGPVREVVQPTK
jgi:hypothetical protein